MSLLHKTVWIAKIEEMLRPKYQILETLAVDESSKIYTDGIARKVTIQNAGGDPEVIVNGSGQLAVSQRADAALTYDVDKYATPARLVTREEALSESPEKMNSVINSIFGAIGSAAMYNTFAKWFSVGQSVVLTTGTDTPNTATGVASGTTKMLTVKDVIAAKAALDAQDVPEDNRILLLPSNMANHLLTELVKTQSNISFVNNDGMMILNQLFYGFTVVQMTRVVQINAGGTAVLHGGTGQTKEVALAYHKDAVRFAKEKEPFLFYTANDPTYQGDIMSGQLFIGGSFARVDKVGVVQIKQA